MVQRIANRKLRMLGVHTVNEICGPWDSLSGLLDHLCARIVGTFGPWSFRGNGPPSFVRHHCEATLRMKSKAGAPKGDL